MRVRFGPKSAPLTSESFGYVEGSIESFNAALQAAEALRLQWETYGWP